MRWRWPPDGRLWRVVWTFAEPAFYGASWMAVNRKQIERLPHSLYSAGMSVTRVDNSAVDCRLDALLLIAQKR